MDNRQAIDHRKEVTPAQLRAARALLGWSREQASKESGIGGATLGRLERDERTPRTSTVEGLVRTFEANGVLFFRDGSFSGAAIADTEPEAGQP